MIVELVDIPEFLCIYVHQITTRQKLFLVCSLTQLVNMGYHHVYDQIRVERM